MLTTSNLQLGQNLNSAGPERNLTDGVNMWWEEKAEFQKTGPSGDGGHVGAALWNEVTAMGCAVVDCSHTPPGYWITACNMNNNGWKDVYPPQATPNCPQAGIVVPYHKKN